LFPGGNQNVKKHFLKFSLLLVALAFVSCAHCKQCGGGGGGGGEESGGGGPTDGMGDGSDHTNNNVDADTNAVEQKRAEAPSMDPEIDRDQSNAGKVVAESTSPIREGIMNAGRNPAAMNPLEEMNRPAPGPVESMPTPTLVPTEGSSAELNSLFEKAAR
jgi:hypothetical protein